MIQHVTRKVVFTVEGPTGPTKDPWGNTRIGFSATTKVNRKDFGLVWNAALEAGGILVGNEVTIALDMQYKVVSINQASRSVAWSSNATAREET